jgi:isopenicillin N synthase-like dioxygenase
MVAVIDCGNNVDSKSTEIFTALRQHGFVYLTNYGFEYAEVVVDNVHSIYNIQVENVENIFKKFWSLPQATKERYKRGIDYAETGNSGYMPSSVTTAQHGDIRVWHESFNVTPREKHVCATHRH